MTPQTLWSGSRLDGTLHIVQEIQNVPELLFVFHSQDVEFTAKLHLAVPVSKESIAFALDRFDSLYLEWLVQSRAKNESIN